jgi:hypothetical protein
MERLLQAYRVLSDGGQRADYDRRIGSASSGFVPPPRYSPVSNTPSYESDALEQFLAKPVVQLLVRQNLDGFAKSWRSAFAKTHDLNRISNVMSWSWAGFLCGPFYFCYRKMYAYAAAWTVAALGVSIVENALSLPAVSSGFFGVSVLIGMYAKGWYFSHVRSQAAKIEAASTEPSVRVALATSKGGSSWAACILVGLLCLVVSSIPDIIAVANGAQ